jgi:hypothetical protein
MHPTMFLFPATAAILLRTYTYMPEIAITNWLRNYGRSGEQFWVNTTRPGHQQYHVRPGNGGFYITAVKLPAVTI